MECERRRKEGVTESEALSDIAKFKALMKKIGVCMAETGIVNLSLKNRGYTRIYSTVLKRKWARQFRLLQPKSQKV